MQSDFEKLRTGVDPLTPLFVLIDPMVGEPLPGFGAVKAGSNATQQREQMWQRDITQIVLSKSIALPEYQHPYLIHLHGPNDPLLEITWSLADEERLSAQAGGLDGDGRAAHRIGGWLQSSMHTDALAETISKMCRVNATAPTTATYLRVADRRVLDLLCYVVGAARVVAQFGRLQSWKIMNATGALLSLQSLDEASVMLSLSSQEWKKMERGHMLHQAMARCLGEAISTGKAEEIFDYPSAEKAIIRAGNAKALWPRIFHNDDDCVTWAVLSMFFSSMNQDLEVKRALDNAAAGESPESIRYFYRELINVLQSVQ